MDAKLAYLEKLKFKISNLNKWTHPKNSLIAGYLPLMQTYKVC
jgi:hypothetical protein